MILCDGCQQPSDTTYCQQCRDMLRIASPKAEQDALLVTFLAGMASGAVFMFVVLLAFRWWPQ